MMTATIDQGRILRRILTFLLLLSTGLLTPLWAGCGIDFGSANEHTEPMTHLRVTGTRKAGEELQVELSYSQTLPVAVAVECRLEQGSEVEKTIGAAAIPANPGGSPEATPTVGSLSFPLRVDRAGEYTVVCVTLADESNELSQAVSIGPAG
jgi:hypothetical protein